MTFTYAWLAGMKAGILHSGLNLYVPSTSRQEDWEFALGPVATAEELARIFHGGV